MSEKLAHYFHALVASVHIIYGVTHSEKHGFDATSARRVVEFRVAVGDVADTAKGGSLLHGVKCFLEAFKPRNLAEGKTYCNRKFVIGDKILEEISR